MPEETEVQEKGICRFCGEKVGDVKICPVCNNSGIKDE